MSGDVTVRARCEWNFCWVIAYILPVSVYIELWVVDVNPLWLSLLVRKEHEKCEFEVHEVYAIDILVSTGEGKVNSFSVYVSVSLLTPLILYLFL